MKHLLFLVFLQLLASLAIAQRNQRFSNDNKGETWYGGGPIANQSNISNIYDMLVDGTIFQVTPYEERSINTLGGTFWTRFGVPYTDFFIEGQFSFLSTIQSKDKLAGGHFYLMNDKGLEYSILFDYDQVNFSFSPGWFLPLPNRDISAFGCYLTAGLTYSTLAGTRIIYTSNEPQFDLAIKAALEQGLKYRNDFLFVPGIGVQYKFNDDDVAIEARYTQGWGLVDILETQQNPYFWREQDNRTRIQHQLALTCLIRFDR